MKPLFTVHAGEYLVGDHIERTYPGWNVWVPSKDTGVDLLVTDKRNQKTVSLQVKFSGLQPDAWVPPSAKPSPAAGWWTTPQ
jgi:hypothetical protein